jgi:hypothetical protein
MGGSVRGWWQWRERGKKEAGERPGVAVVVVEEVRELMGGWLSWE